MPAPGEARRQRAERQLADRERREHEAWEARFAPATTRDGHRVEVAANLGNTAHAADAVSRGAEGVGLLRTEFLFMAHAEAPDLETQMAEYREALDALDGRPLVARTLDVGGDKPLPYWPVPQEDNPFLGLRGIRLALTRPDVLATQLEALLRAAVAGRCASCCRWSRMWPSCVRPGECSIDCSPTFRATSVPPMCNWA